MKKSVLTGLEINPQEAQQSQPMPEGAPMGGLGGLMGAMMGGMGAPIPPMEGESIEETIIDQANQITIVNVSPYSIDIIPQDNKYMVVLAVFALDDQENLHIITRSYFAESKEDIDRIKEIPFYSSEKFNSFKTTQNIVSKGCRMFETNYEFFSTDDENKFYIEALEVKKNNEKVSLYMDTNIMSCLAFLDLYIFKTVTSLHSLSKVCIAGINMENESDIETYYPDSVESLVAMAPVNLDKKLFSKSETTQVVVQFKYIKFLNSEEKDTCSLLTPFDIGVSFQKNKFKNHTVAEIQKEYLVDSDQYMSEFIVGTVHIKGDDKDYLLIRAKNKDNKRRLFMLSNDIQTSMINKITDY